MKLNLARAVALMATALLTLPIPSVFAQSYPDKPIRLIVPLAAGGGTDFFARILASQLSTQMKQPVIVENKPGGGTNIGADSVAKSAPDGYTLLLSSSTTYAINAALYNKMPYNPAKDLAPIALTGRFALVLVVNPSVPINSINELIEHAKAKPDSLDYASSGPGSPHQLAMELLKQRTGITANHIPYKGAAPALQDVLGGRVPMMFIDYASGAAHIKSGKLRAIAVATPERLSFVPDLPTIAESGVPGFEASAWQGLTAPAGTPEPIIQHLNNEVGKALATPAVRQRLLDAGVVPIFSSPAEFATYAASETKKWADVIKKGKITID